MVNFIYLSMFNLKNERTMKKVKNFSLTNLRTEENFGFQMDVKALAEYVMVELKKEDIQPLYHEGTGNGIWVCIDYGDIMVHIMRKNEREFYNLESIWGGCPKI